MRIACSLIAALLALAPAALRAQGPAAIPTYQRTRGGGDGGAHRGNAGHWGGAPGFGGLYPPYFAPAPIIVGSYYQRPYPHHFDYYRHRWGQQPQSPLQQQQSPPNVEMMPVADCPCLAAEPAAP